MADDSPKAPLARLKTDRMLRDLAKTMDTGGDGMTLHPKPYEALHEGTRQLIDGIIFLEEMREGTLRNLGMATTTSGALDRLDRDLGKRITQLRTRYAFDIQLPNPQHLAVVHAQVVMHHVAELQRGPQSEHMKALMNLLTNLPYPTGRADEPPARGR